MSIGQRIFTSDAAAWVVFVCSAAFMIAALVGWDPTFGAVDRAWWHPVLMAVLGAAAVSGWFTYRAKHRDTAGNEGLRGHASKGLRLGLVAFLFSLGMAVALGGYIR